MTSFICWYLFKYVLYKGFCVFDNVISNQYANYGIKCSLWWRVLSEMRKITKCQKPRKRNVDLASIFQAVSTCNSQFKCQKKWLANYILKLFIVFWNNQFCSVQSLSRVRLFATSWIAARQASLSITNSRSLLKLMSIESVMPSNHLILCRPLLLLPPVPPSIRVFSNESTLLMRWPKNWSFSFNISPSNEHPGLISFRMDWLDLLAVQGTLKILLQHHSSNASILWHSTFFTVQLSHPYMTTGKTIALTRRTFVGKVMSLLFNILSRLVITFLPSNKCLSISWPQSPSAVILEPRKIKSATVSPSICHEDMGLDAMILVFWMLSQLFYSPLSLSSRGFFVPLPSLS